MKIITRNGFTLIEMAMVLMIIGLLLAGLIPTLSAQMESQRINETRKQLEEIKEALIGYAISKGRLPCPADSTTPAGQANASGVSAGMEYKNPATGACANIPGLGTRAWGAVPWVNLGVGETDAWGRRFAYRVTNSFADLTDGAGANGSSVPCALPAPASGVSFQLCSGGNFEVISKSSGGVTIANDISALIVSHGKNGLGAYTQNGTQISGASGDELTNSNITFMGYVSHDATPNFDDLVVWISPNVLFNRMVTAGKLP